MVKQLILPFAAVAIFIMAVGLFAQKSSSINIPWLSASSTTSPTSTTTKSVTIAGKSINIEIANTQSLRAKGLSGRTSLEASSGMLFVFDSKQVSPIFWMKDMLIPLDIIWISSDKVVKIDKNIPFPAANTPDNELDKISPNQPIDYVLEVNAKFADNNKLKVGDSVTLPTL